MGVFFGSVDATRQNISSGAVQVVTRVVRVMALRSARRTDKTSRRPCRVAREGVGGGGCPGGTTAANPRGPPARRERAFVWASNGHSAGDDSDDDGTRCNVRHVVRVRPLVARCRRRRRRHRRSRCRRRRQFFRRRRRRPAVDPRAVVRDVHTAGRMRVGRVRGVGADRLRVHTQTTGHQQLRETLSGLSVEHDTRRDRRPRHPRTPRTLLLYVFGRAVSRPWPQNGFH